MSGGRDPVTFHSSLSFGWNFPIGGKTTEMVEAHPMVKPEIVLHTADPPAEAVILEYFPIVNRITPELSFFAEIVGWNPGNTKRFSFFIKFKNIAIGPDIGTVVGNIDGHIPNEFHPNFIKMVFKLSPLAEENPLAEFYIQNLAIELSPQCRRPSSVRSRMSSAM